MRGLPLKLLCTYLIKLITNILTYGVSDSTSRDAVSVILIPVLAIYSLWALALSSDFSISSYIVLLFLLLFGN